MKTEKDKEIDDLFKQGLEPSDTHAGYEEGDWNAMKQMLDERKKRPGIIYWLPILGSVAALLLLVIGWWLLKPVVTHPRQTQQMAANSIDTVTPNAAKPRAVQQSNGEKQQLTAKNVNGVTPPKTDRSQKLPAGSGNTNIANNTNTVRHTRIYNKVNNTANKYNYTANQYNNTVQMQQNGDNRQYSADLVAYNPGGAITEPQTNVQTIKPGNYLANDISNKSNINISKRKAAYPTRPQFAITVLAASDKNSVSSFQQAKPGNNTGLLFSIGLGRKFTISTGAIYDAKQYMSSFANYHTSYQFQTNPVSVLADCKMFDIPLNIDYQIYNKHRNKISVGTGLSSYLMLHENYQFTYGADGSWGEPTHYNVPNPNKYLLSMANLQATYERRINSNVGITLQPYMKLPLSAVGASQVRLQSTGIAVGLTWNLNSSSKP